MQNYVDDAIDARIITASNPWKVSRIKWEALSQNHKANISIGMYCQVANKKGVGSIVVTDKDTNEQLAKVVNGHFTE